jgi:hypothetical protein
MKSATARRLGITPYGEAQSKQMVSAAELCNARDVVEVQNHVPSRLDVTAHVPAVAGADAPTLKSPFDRESAVTVIGVDLHEALLNLMSRHVSP